MEQETLETTARDRKEKMLQVTRSLAGSSEANQSCMRGQGEMKRVREVKGKTTNNKITNIKSTEDHQTHYLEQTARSFQ